MYYNLVLFNMGLQVNEASFILLIHAYMLSTQTTHADRHMFSDCSLLYIRTSIIIPTFSKRAINLDQIWRKISKKVAYMINLSKPANIS